MYLGNFHVSPISRLWNTQTTIMGMKDFNKDAKTVYSDPDQSEDEEAKPRGRGRKLALMKT